MEERVPSPSEAGVGSDPKTKSRTAIVALVDGGGPRPT